MAHELLSYDYNPEELEASGMSAERYVRALHASKFVARVIKAADQQKPDSIPEDIFDKFVAGVTLNRTIAKIDRIQRQANYTKKARGSKPHKQVMQLDTDSLAELAHFRRDGAPVRAELVERGYDITDITTISWEDASSLHGWHRSSDTLQKYHPDSPNSAVRMIDFVAERAGIKPVLPIVELS